MANVPLESSRPMKPVLEATSLYLISTPRSLLSSTVFSPKVMIGTLIDTAVDSTVVVVVPLTTRFPAILTLPITTFNAVWLAVPVIVTRSPDVWVLVLVIVNAPPEALLGSRVVDCVCMPVTPAIVPALVMVRPAVVTLPEEVMAPLAIVVNHESAPTRVRRSTWSQCRP